MRMFLWIWIINSIKKFLEEILESNFKNFIENSQKNLKKTTKIKKKL